MYNIVKNDISILIHAIIDKRFNDFNNSVFLNQIIFLYCVVVKRCHESRETYQIANKRHNDPFMHFLLYMAYVLMIKNLQRFISL